MFKLQVKAEKHNIRSSPFADPTFANWIGERSNGEVYTAVKIVKGEKVDDNDNWYVDDLNRFTSAAWVNDVTNYQDWMIDLRLAQIWATATGTGVGVAVVDTGIVLNNPEISFDKNTFNTYKNSNSLNDLSDSAGHGTICASIIGARNTNGNFIGVAPGCNLFIYKISDVANQQNTDQLFNRTMATKMANAIDWCAEQSQIKVISISWTILLDDEDDNDRVAIKQIQDSIDNANKQKKIIVAGRGNINSSGDATKLYPVCLQNVLSVGIGENHPNFSGFIDILTYGINIFGYSLQSQPIADSGTSMSTAIIAGIICLIIQKQGLQTDVNDIRSTLKLLCQNSPLDNLPELNGSLLINFFKQ